MSKKCTPCWREAHFQVKMYKAHQGRSIFGSCDVEKVNAVVAQETARPKLKLSSPQDVAFATPRHHATEGRAYASNLASHQKAGFAACVSMSCWLLPLSSSFLYAFLCFLSSWSISWPLLSDALPLLSAGVGGYLANAVTCWTSQYMLQTWTPLIILQNEACSMLLEWYLEAFSQARR